MLTNYHTHTTFCDGDNTAEEMVKSAIEKGFSALGFSGHGYTAFDHTYCMQDTNGYIAEINRLKEKYKKDIQIYLGIEENVGGEAERSDFDYLMGSSHYFRIDGAYYPIDSNPDCFKKCLDLFGGDVLNLAESYYTPFCEYILKRKPDIIGHFDLITKFDEMGESIFFSNEKYLKLSEKYLREAMKSGSIFEVNTGAISRGYRTAPYPHINLLHILKKEGGKIIINSDSHAADTLDCHFKETKKMLKDIGFQYTYILYDNEFKKNYL